MVLHTSNFTVGQKVKGYEEMCQLFCEDIKKGRPRDRQIENWGRFIKWDRKGHKYIITEIYDSPNLKVNGKSKGGKRIYSEGLKKLIMHNIFLKHEIGVYEINDNTFRFTTNELTTEIFDCDYILNEDFIQEKSDIFENNNINNFDITHFVSAFKSKTSDILKDALESLVKNKQLDFCKNIYVIKYKEEHENKERYASEEETEKIHFVKKKIMNDMGIKNERYTQETKRVKLYERLVKELKSSDNWTGLYKIKLLKINKEILYKLKEHELSSSEIEFLKKNLLLKLCDFLDQNASKLYKKDKEKIENYYIKSGLDIDTNQDNNQLSNRDKRRSFGVDTRYILPFRILEKNFVKKQTLLINILIRNNLLCK